MLYVEGEIIYAWPNAAQLGKGSRTSYTNTNLKSDQTYYYLSLIHILPKAGLRVRAPGEGAGYHTGAAL